MFILAYVSIDSFRFITNDIERAVFFVVAITLVSVVPAFIVNELKNKFE
jgi:ABC-type taurine transport system ATPase subunit